jgi:uncharacterized protein
MEKLRIQNSIKSILELDNNVVFAFLFGSTARNDVHYGSDIDIAIYFNEDQTLQAIGNLNLILEEAVNYKTDLVELNNLDKNNPILAYSIVSEGIIIINKDTNLFNRYKRSVLLHYLDFKPTNDLINANFKNRLSNNMFAVFEK